MSASTVAVPSSRGTAVKIIFRIVIALVFLVVLAAAAAFAWFYRATHASLPQLDGAISVAGLQAPVSVVRDAHGVPHLTATSLEDLFFAQGYVAAQDRLWQMDMTRRAAAGEMAEILPASSAPAPAPSRSTSVVRRRTS